jgi:hypothetical protein
MHRIITILSLAIFACSCGGVAPNSAKKKVVHVKIMKENGDVCQKDADCASNVCRENRTNEKRCYGTKKANETCTNAFDCFDGACLQTKTNSVCTPAIVHCSNLGMSDACIDNIIVTCMFFSFCSEPIAEDVNNCFAFMCGVRAAINWSDQQCVKDTSIMQGGFRACPGKKETYL